MNTVQAIGVGFGVTVGIGAACVAFVMCGATAMKASEAAPAPIQVAAEVPSTAPQAPEGAPAPQRPTAQFSLATFDGDVLDECADVTITAQPGQEDHSAEMAEDYGGKLMKTQSSVSALRLKKSCAEQFAGRTVFGTCRMEGSKNGHDQILVLAQYTARNVVGNDTAMKDCLRLDGDWTAGDPGDLAQAKHDQQRAKLEQRLKQVQQFANSQ